MLEIIQSDQLCSSLARKGTQAAAAGLPPRAGCAVVVTGHGSLSWAAHMQQQAGILHCLLFCLVGSASPSEAAAGRGNGFNAVSVF